MRNDDRAQDTDCDEPGDTFDTSNARINRPYSRIEHDVKLDATYRVLPSTKVALGYAFENINRDLTEVENTYEHTGSIKVMSRPLSFANGWLKYSYSDRSGSNFISNVPLLATSMPEHIAAEFEENGVFEEATLGGPLLTLHLTSLVPVERSLAIGLSLMPVVDVPAGKSILTVIRPLFDLGHKAAVRDLLL